MRRALVYGLIATAVVAVVGGIIGLIVAGGPGLVSALIGAALTAVFMGFTTLSIVIADRATKGKTIGAAYFGIIMGVWVLKFVIFIVVLLAIRGQDWVNPYVFFFSVIAAVICSLVADAVALVGARVPYVDVELPGQS